MSFDAINKDVARRLGHSAEEMKIWGNDPAYDYCHSMEAVQEVLGHLQAKGHTVDLMITRTLARCTIRHGDMGLIDVVQDAGPKELPLAICKAFLKLEGI